MKARATSRGKRGRRRKTPLLQQIQEAYARLHDLDWLQGCELARLPEVWEGVDTELGVGREWCSRAYRSEGLSLASA